ncbi:hypothetical protein [Sphaerimonospora thailandensis]|uniref:Uncharacterized protein n=1 Tax=Sphaerimonospora thailandensis TaxID=795644 RepID=A0A8J3RAC8_9ACTN|nr:hypothetical protein [Sphaerimonospora thailandensis]GIH70287.1 hypothetical protein Mth01_25400 [Sphaerimonospora thailandensis]
MKGLLDLLIPVVLVFVGALVVVIVGFWAWGAWDARQARRQTAETRARFDAIVAADLHDVFPAEDC